MLGDTILSVTKSTGILSSKYVLIIKHDRSVRHLVDCVYPLQQGQTCTTIQNLSGKYIVLHVNCYSN